MARFQKDTDMGGPGTRFPLTRRSDVQATRSDDPRERSRAINTLVAAYWKPVYKYIRLTWNASNEEAKDLTQGFFADAIERELLARYEPTRASFRTWLRTCLDGYVANARKAERRLKRGGGQPALSLDFDTAELEFLRQSPMQPTEAGDFFEREWTRSLFELAIAALRERCDAAGKIAHFQIFEQYDLCRDEHDPRITYEQLASRFGVPVSQVTNHLAWARREFRTCVLAKLRELTRDDDEFRAEARRLMGDDRP